MTTKRWLEIYYELSKSTKLQFTTSNLIDATNKIYEEENKDRRTEAMSNPPATEKQIKYLESMGWTNVKQLTKREASDKIKELKDVLDKDIHNIVQGMKN